jgi:hypothetical protein
MNWFSMSCRFPKNIMLKSNRSSAMRMNTFYGGLLAAVGCLAVLYSCSSNQSLFAGDVVDTPNTEISGSVLDSTGEPVARAIVRLRHDDYATPLPGDQAREKLFRKDTVTDRSGVFAFAAVNTGFYTVEINTGNGFAVTVSCTVSTDTSNVDAGKNRLSRVGVIRGIVPMADLTGAAWFVQVLGLERIAAVDPATGSFVLNTVPRGLFTVRLAAKKTDTVSSIDKKVNVVPGDTITIPYASWKFSKRLVLNTTASGAKVPGNVTGFPVLIRLSQSNFNFAGAKSDGADIRFAKQDNTPLSFEIERWDSAKGLAEIWVKVDTVFGNDNTRYFTVYWGNSNAASVSNSAAVFDTANGFQGVWHLNQAAHAAAGDATKNHYDGTPSDTAPVPAPGMIGTAYEFDGVSNSIVMNGTANSTMNFAQNGYYTVSAWVFADTLDYSGASDTTYKNDMTIVSKDNCQYALKTRSTNWQFFEYHNNVGWQGTFAPAQKRSWKYVVGVREGSRQYMYVDGVCVADSVNTFLGSTEPRSTAADVAIGKMPGKQYPSLPTDGPGYYFNGKIDEVRISSVALSANWIKLCFMNQRAENALAVFQ